MTYLACTIGACEYIHMTPITDRAESLAVLTGNPSAAPARQGPPSARLR